MLQLATLGLGLFNMLQLATLGLLNMLQLATLGVIKYATIGDVGVIKYATIGDVRVCVVTLPSEGTIALNIRTPLRDSEILNVWR
jgi:hypothetical protein